MCKVSPEKSKNNSNFGFKVGKSKQPLTEAVNMLLNANEASSPLAVKRGHLPRHSDEHRVSLQFPFQPVGFSCCNQR